MHFGNTVLACVHMICYMSICPRGIYNFTLLHRLTTLFISHVCAHSASQCFLSSYAWKTASRQSSWVITDIHTQIKAYSDIQWLSLIWTCHVGAGPDLLIDLKLAFGATTWFINMFNVVVNKNDSKQTRLHLNSQDLPSAANNSGNGGI